MRPVFKELWRVFWDACKETPKGMFAPFVAFWHTATHNPILQRSTRNKHSHG